MFPVKVQFWFDPACPWCWLTSRWLADEVAPQRDLVIDWQPISLLFMNEPSEDSNGYESLLWTTKLLRVVESMRDAGLEDRIGDFYRVLGERIHHDGEMMFDHAPILADLGIPAEHAAAFDDGLWDAAIQKGHDDGLSLTGDDVGTPIIAIETGRGERVGLFGPVISKKPAGAAALMLWDGFLLMVETDGFWELKRTRTEGPQLPA